MKISILLIALNLCSISGLFAQRYVNRKPVNPEVIINRLGDDINTENPDFAPARYIDRIYFTSMYKNEADGSTFSRILSFREGESASIVDNFDMHKKSVHIANVAFMPDASRMYFTICHDEDQEDCEIWFRNRQYDGIWGVAQRLPDYINQKGTTTTQPSIGWDEEQKKFALFFVSNREGGRGGKDIWVSHINWEGRYETPYPLRINTPQDEVTPYFNRSTQTLYFSSNGLDGVGRFDIYKSKKQGDQFENPVNLVDLTIAPTTICILPCTTSRKKPTFLLTGRDPSVQKEVSTDGAVTTSTRPFLITKN